MPQIVPLQVLPNQHLTITLDQQKYDITLKTITDLTYATISVNGTKVIDNVRCIPLHPLLPYKYLEGVGGNFVFYTTNDELPNYMSFGVTHVLVYASVAELVALRAAEA